MEDKKLIEEVIEEIFIVKDEYKNVTFHRKPLVECIGLAIQKAREEIMKEVKDFIEKKGLEVSDQVFGLYQEDWDEFLKTWESNKNGSM